MPTAYDDLDEPQQKRIQQHAYLIRTINIQDTISGRGDLAEIDAIINGRNGWQGELLSTLTCPQLKTHIDNNVTDLASAREFLKTLSCAVLWLAKQNNL